MGKALYYTCAMISRTLVKYALNSEAEMPDVLIQGWVRTRRDSKAFSFLEVNDGSSVASLQVVADAGIPGYERIGEMTTGSAVSVRGALVAGQGRQRWELRAASLELVGTAPDSYPCRKRGIRRNSCVPSPICAPAPTCLAPCSACVAGWPMPSTGFPGEGLFLGQHAHYYRQRLRGRR